VTVGLLYLAYLIWPNSGDWLRYSGLAFEMLGIVTVWAGLRDRRILFGKQSEFAKLSDWLKRFPLPGAQPRVIEVRGISGGLEFAGQAKATLWRGTSASSSIEDRVVALEANVQTLRKELTNLEQWAQKETQERQDTDNVERQKRESNYKDINATLESLGAGNLPLETLGLIWLALGVILSTLSQA
jgi:hypothetical protein